MVVVDVAHKDIECGIYAPFIPYGESDIARQQQMLQD